MGTDTPGSHIPGLHRYDAQRPPSPKLPRTYTYLKTEHPNAHEWMEMCIEVAEGAPYGIGKPYVGAIVVSREGRISGAGHKEFIPHTSRLVHAERGAINAAAEDARGGTLVTTLEPCVCVGSRNYLFKPCSSYIVDSGISTVIIGHFDHSPMINGKGVDYLLRNKVKVIWYDGLADIIDRKLLRSAHTTPTMRPRQT